MKLRKSVPDEENEITLFTALTTYWAYIILIVFGHLRDVMARCGGRSRYFGKHTEAYAAKSKGLVPLHQSWDNFYTRRLYHRIQDCWSRPISSAPGARINVIQRNSKDNQCTMDLNSNADEDKQMINLGSYNYLGFADDWGATCRTDVVEALDGFNISCCAARMDAGTTALHAQVETTVADFVGKPAAIVFNMGYATNSSTIPALLGPGDLIISDSLNHTSIVNGARASGAKVRVFRHDDVQHLENVLRKAIEHGQPRKPSPWQKIVVVVEGIYSMEGEICNLPEIVRVAKRYKAYIYVDEAHSVGALGATGRGVCEYSGVDPADIDVLMGTFTKSFGGMGGYIAGSTELIAYLRSQSIGAKYSVSMSPLICQQVITALNCISGKDGTGIGPRKLQALKDNSNYFRKRLVDMGTQVYGHYDSPIIPMVLYNPTKIAAFSRECYARGLAVVVVGFPATPMMTSRARFCISAAHTREELDLALEKIEEVCDLLKLKYRDSAMG